MEIHFALYHETSVVVLPRSGTLPTKQLYEVASPHILLSGSGAIGSARFWF